MAAPIPIPNEVKRRRGNPGKRALPALSEVDDLAPATVTPPEHLGERGAAIWSHVTATAPWVGASDQGVLLELAEMYDKREELKAALKVDGWLLMTSTGYQYLNPAAAALNAADRHVLKLLSHLGLTPADRSRLGLAEVKVASKLEALRESRARRGA